ncbi:hypothetical protein G6F22_009127 [Rhizopus arrhizus]|nr:hypothetical protein G6F22_009127 [Rhizopus arrhizus]
MGEQQLKSLSNSLPSNQESLQQTKPTNFWMKRWKVPGDLQSTPGSKVNNMMKMRKTTPLEHLDYHQVLNTWKPRSQEASEKTLAKSLLQIHQVEEVVEGISRLQLGTVIEEDVDFMDEVEQKTIFGEGDVGSRPSTTTVIPTISTVQHQQTIQHRERPTSNTTNITIFSTTSSIITSSFTSSIINPYYNFNNQLHHSLRWHSTGQSPTTFPPLLENNNQSSLAFIRDSKWLQNPIYQKTDPMEESEENDDNRRSTSYQRSSTKIPEWTDDRGNDKEKTDPGLPKIELVHPSRTLQAGESSSTKRTYGKRRLHLQNRFKRRIRSCPNTRRLPRLFKLRERRNCLPIQIPSEQQLATWDVSILMDYITNQLSPTSTLSLAQLQLKTILLFCIATMWRPRSDIGRLQYRDVILNQDDMTTNIRIHARKPKEGQIKSIILGTVEDNQVCPVRTAHESILQTAVKRQTLTEDHIFLLTYLDSSKKQATSVRPTTVTNWIKAAMDKAGIDINHY